MYNSFIDEQEESSLINSNYSYNKNPHKELQSIPRKP